MGDQYAPFRVLCVDDNQDAADSTARLMLLVGFEARACYDGWAALEVAEELQPAVCLLDLNMPGMDGNELAVRLHEQGRPVILVAVTAQADDEASIRTGVSGFVLHLVKPVDPPQLIAVVDALFHVSQLPALSLEGG